MKMHRSRERSVAVRFAAEVEAVEAVAPLVAGVAGVDEAVGAVVPLVAEAPPVAEVVGVVGEAELEAAIVDSERPLAEIPTLEQQAATSLDPGAARVQRAGFPVQAAVLVGPRCQS